MANNNPSNFMQNIAKLQEQYYSANQKNRFMKKQQKHDCASTITTHVGVDTLLSQSIAAFDEYKIYVDYTVLKTFMCPDNYSQVVDYLMNIMNTIVTMKGKFHLYVNLNSLTISAIERYRDLIMSISQRCMDDELEQYLEVFHMHNSPSFLTSTSNLLAPFMPDTVRKKIKFIHKNEANDLPPIISKKIN